MKDIHRFNTINQFHEFSNLPSPEHLLFSVIDNNKVKYPLDSRGMRWIQNFYSIGLKRNIAEKCNYGRQEYDFNEGIFTFVGPQQTLSIEMDQQAQSNPSGWLLLIHPDFLCNTALSDSIKSYDFFGYAIKEALFLSRKEEEVIVEILKNIEIEYGANIDKFSDNIIVSQLELLLNYAVRYYERQFLTRNIANHRILGRLEQLLEACFEDENMSENGTPTVTQIADSLQLTSTAKNISINNSFVLKFSLANVRND